MRGVNSQINYPGHSEFSEISEFSEYSEFSEPSCVLRLTGLLFLMIKNKNFVSHFVLLLICRNFVIYFKPNIYFLIFSVTSYYGTN